MQGSTAALASRTEPARQPAPRTSGATAPPETPQMRFISEVPDGEWRLPAGDYANARYSPLSQINTGNVSRLRMITSLSTGMPRGHEGQPLVVNGTMDIVTPYPNNLMAELNVFYHGTANPGVRNPDLRPGDNKWSCTIFPRDADTGEPRRAYQISPHDQWDYDEIMENILVDMKWRGRADGYDLETGLPVVGGWMGAVAFPAISADDPYAALGTVYVFGL